MHRWLVAARSAALAVLCLLAGCAGQQPAGPGTSSQAPAREQAIGPACRLLTAQQVRGALNSAPVRPVAGRAASAGLTQCRYRAGDADVLTVTVVGGYRSPGRAAVRAFADPRAQPRTLQEIPDLADGAVTFRTRGDGAGVALAVEIDSGTSVIGLQGRAGRDVLIGLARLVPANV